METIFNCDGCETSIEREADVWHASEISGKEFCDGCWTEDINAGSSAFIVGPDFASLENEPVRALIGNHFVINKYGDDWDWDSHSKNVKFRRAYHSTDAWRGYYETKIEGWTEIVDGWTTGGWGDPTAERKLPFNKWAEALYEGKIVSPVNVAVITDPTSNVFSTAVGVHVPDDKADEFREWLNGELENLRYALS